MSYPTPAPYPGPSSYPAPAASGSLIPPSPLQLGQVFSTAATLLKQRLGLFLGLSAISAVVLTVLPLLGIGAFVALVASASFNTHQRNAPVGALVGGGLLMLAVILASYLVQIKLTAMMIALARDTGEGRRPTMGELAAETKGVVVRSLGVIAVLVGAVVLVYGVMIGVMLAALAGASAGSRSGSGSGSAAFGVAGVLLMLLFLALAVGAFVVGVRITYWQQAVALEGASGFAPLKRSWALTKGDFWRTLGWVLCLGLIAMAASWVLQILTSAITLPLQAGLTAQLDAAGDDSTAAVGAIVMAMLPLFGITFLGSALLQLLYAPYASCYMTTMFGDAVQRRAMKDAGIDPAQIVPGYGYAGVPAGGYYPQVGQQPYGQGAYDPNAGYAQPGPDAYGQGAYGQGAGYPAQPGQYPHQQAYDPRPYGAPSPASAQPNGAHPWTPPADSAAGPYASGPVGQQAFGDAPRGDRPPADHAPEQSTEPSPEQSADPSIERPQEGDASDDRR